MYICWSLSSTTSIYNFYMFSHQDVSQCCSHFDLGWSIRWHSRGGGGWIEWQSWMDFRKNTLMTKCLTLRYSLVNSSIDIFARTKLYQNKKPMKSNNKTQEFNMVQCHLWDLRPYKLLFYYSNLKIPNFWYNIIFPTTNSSSAPQHLTLSVTTLYNMKIT